MSSINANKMDDIEVTPKIAQEHGLTDDEYKKITELTGRTPTFTELGIWSAMWNEHCSYKSSAKWLKTLPTTGPQVIHGPGENAGVVDIGDGDAVVFKMESHNHPSFIEPFQGAATGVGGILRDIFTMGARPIATMNALRFGEPDNEKTPHFVSQVVAGIGFYGNSFGVPCVGGEVNFHKGFNGNILVNAFAAGIVKTKNIALSKAKGVGLPVVYLGAKTGTDGVGGATMASAEFGDSTEAMRPTVQVGDPFLEKCLLEACLELISQKAVVAIQDMGAAGLTCSAVEMGAKGNLGIKLDLDKVPVRQKNMSAYQMMLSESQERMLMVLNPKKEKQAKKIFEKWELDFTVVGETTDDLRFRVSKGGEEVANLPIKELGDEAPEYDRPFIEPGKHSPKEPHEFPPPDDYNAALLKIISSPDLCSKRFIYEQYDTLIGGNTLQTPGGDAGVVRVEDSNKALAFSSDVTPRYVEADPQEGTKQAVAECYRNLVAVGARPLAITDNMNFGNPEKPEIMGQFVSAIKGITEASEMFGMPVVSGNVSFYNETNNNAIPPTPTIAGVGLISEYSKIANVNNAQKDDALFLVGTEATHLSQTIYEREILGQETGPPPEVDLKKEKVRGEFVLAAIQNEYASACHDISDGGLAIAITEMCIQSNIGVVIEGEAPYYAHAALFGEDQGRYIVAVKQEWADMFAANSEGSGVSFEKIGKFGGNKIIIYDLVDIELKETKKAHDKWFNGFNSK